MRKRKFNYYRVLQGLYCGFWSDLIFLETDSNFIALSEKEQKEFRSDIKAYKDNDPRPYRVIKRREKTA